ncbi:ABC transporter ATP-binding protein [Gordonia sp. CPCC 205333]|uniref:ABC transporter ATP-binding protein n=1 Tax=Gordonia sp. CPCC 205333 TaxID=3140790 RepID=UPI003AF3A843
MTTTDKSTPTDLAAKSGAHQNRLAATGLTVGYDGPPIISDLDIAIADKAITTVIGPNGCGKSTLLRTMARLLRPSAGTVWLDGADITTIKPRTVARTLGLLPQNPIAPDGLTVFDLVARGRHPHQHWYQQASVQDERAIVNALQLTDTLDLADRHVGALSGGQRQRVWIALTLAQETDLLLLDEPTTFLDLAHSIEVLDLVQTLRTEHGKTVIMVLHDLNLAARYSDSLFVMRSGEIVAHGSPAEVLTTQLLNDAFGLRSQIIEDPVSGGPLIVPVGSRR